MACEDTRQLSEAQRQAGYQQQRTGVPMAVRPFSGRPTIENLIDYINRELQPAVRQTRSAVNDVYLQVTDNAPSGNPLSFYFSDATAAADPTAGRIRLNQAVQDTATVIRVSESNARLDSVLPWLDVMAGGATSPLGVITLTDAINPARFVRFDLNSMTDQGAYWDLGVTPIESSHDNPFVDGGGVAIGFIPGVGGSTPATVPPTSISGADGPRQFLATSTGTAVDWRTLNTIFPGAPIYDVMAYPFNATGSLAGDDTAAINAAIAAANVTPGVIYLGQAHRVTSALTAVTMNNVVICGRGRFNGGTIVQDASTNGVAVFTINNCQYSGVRDVWITGSTVKSAGWGVRIVNCFRARAENILVSQCYGGVEIVSSVLTDLVEIQLSDTYGPVGFDVYGSLAGGYCHATFFYKCGGGTGFPIGVTGVPATDWQPSTAYATGATVTKDGIIYQAASSGTSGLTGPSGMGSTNVNTAHTTPIADGSVTWYFAMPACTWFRHGSFAHTVELITCGGLQGKTCVEMLDHSPGSGSAPLFLRVYNLEVDHPYGYGINLASGAHARFVQTFVTSVLNGPGINIATEFTGDWEFNGGEIFGAQQQGIVIGAGGGSLRGMDIGAVSYAFDNQYDAIEIAAGVDNVTVTDCSTDFLTPLVHRYSCSVGAGCTNITVTGNRFGGALTAPILRTPDQSTTVIVRDNTPLWAAHVASDSYDTQTIAVGTNTLVVPATKNTVFITVGSAGDCILDLVQHGAGNPGIQLTIVKATNTGRILLRDGNAGNDSIWLPFSADWPLTRTSDSVRLEHAFGRWRPISPARTAVRFNSTGSELIRRRLNFIPGTGVTITPSDDSTNEEVDITIAATAVGLTDGDKGDITVSSSGATWTIDNDVVSDAKLRNSAALSVIGRSANSTGDPADITAGTDGFVLRRSGTTLGFGTVADAGLRNSAALSVIGREQTTSGVVADITANAVSNAGHVLKVENAGTGLAWGTVANQGLAQMSQSRIKGRDEGVGTGDPQDLTPTQVVAIIDAESPTWTGSHTFTGTLFNVNTTSNVTIASGSTLTLAAASQVTIGSPLEAQGAALFTSAMRWAGIISVTISADVDDWAPTGLSGAHVIRVTASGGNRTINSISGGANGRVIIIINVSSNLVTIPNNGGTGSASNKIVHNMDAPFLAEHETMTLWYDGTTSRWRVIALAGSFNV